MDRIHFAVNDQNVWKFLTADNNDNKTPNLYSI